MQQTTKYKLNLIERDDVFSPDALNENAQKVETAISAEAQARANAISSEAQARTSAINSEAQTRANADSAETQARTAAINSEAQTRANADSAEAQARINAINSEAQTRAAADSALSARVQTLELHQFVVGYVSAAAVEQLGATPQAVLAFGGNSFTGATVGHAGQGLQIVDGGFSHGGYFATCNYIAFF